MLDENLFNKVYVDYTLYSVIKLKDKYGFRIKLYFKIKQSSFFGASS